jgi:hypothetical protein
MRDAVWARQRRLRRVAWPARAPEGAGRDSDAIFAPSQRNGGRKSAVFERRGCGGRVLDSGSLRDPSRPRLCCKGIQGNSDQIIVQCRAQGAEGGAGKQCGAPRVRRPDLTCFQCRCASRMHRRNGFWAASLMDPALGKIPAWGTVPATSVGGISRSLLALVVCIALLQATRQHVPPVAEPMVPFRAAGLQSLLRLRGGIRGAMPQPHGGRQRKGRPASGGGRNLENEEEPSVESLVEDPQIDLEFGKRRAPSRREVRTLRALVRSPSIADRVLGAMRGAGSSRKCCAVDGGVSRREAEWAGQGGSKWGRKESGGAKAPSAGAKLGRPGAARTALEGGSAWSASRGEGARPPASLSRRALFAPAAPPAAPHARGAERLSAPGGQPHSAGRARAAAAVARAARRARPPGPGGGGVAAFGVGGRTRPRGQDVRPGTAPRPPPPARSRHLATRRDSIRFEPRPRPANALGCG